MTKLEQIKDAIETLPPRDFARLHKWFADKYWEKWDRRLERDATSGRLDFLREEARDEKKGGRLEDL